MKNLSLCKNQINHNYSLKRYLLHYISESPQKTQSFAKTLTKKWLHYSKHIFFLLEGSLGVGKTQFVKGVAQKLNFKSNNIHSPTFVFITDFIKKNLILYHIDFYRIEKKYITKILVEHIEEIQNYVKQKTVTCIEWANKINPKIFLQLAKENDEILFIKIKISFIKKNYRKIIVTKL